MTEGPKKKEGWQDFMPHSDAEPHHDPISAPKLIKRGSERLGSMAASIQHRFSQAKKPLYTETMCRLMAKNMLHPEDLPRPCVKYEDLVDEIKTRERQYRRGS